MAHIDELVRELNDQRLRAWEAGKAILDRAADEKRPLTAEEQAAYDQADAEISAIDATRDAAVNSEQRRVELEHQRAEYERVIRPEILDRAADDEADRLRSFFRRGGACTEMDVDLGVAARHARAARMGLTGAEYRVVAGDVGASGGSLTIPTAVAASIYSYLTASTAMRRMNTTVITTDGGAPISFPRTTTHGVATQVADQDTAFAGTDPVVGQLTFNAYDSGQLIPVGNDLIEDSGVDILGFVTAQIGRAIGEHTAAWYVTGSGSGQPNGVMTAVTGAGTIATGGSLVDPTFEKLIDLVYSVNDNYRARGAEWLMRDLTAATVRKIRDGAGGTTGAFIWQPSPTAGLAGGQPDLLLGYPVATDPNVASLASNAKVVAFGDFSAYYIRDVRSLRLERSDDLYFNKNQVAFRGLLRTDGDLLDSNAVNVMKRSV